MSMHPVGSRSRILRTVVAGAVFGGVVFGGCASSLGNEAVFLRVRNEGSVPLQAVVVVLPEGERIAADRLEAGEATPPARVAAAYRYAYVEATAGARRIVLQPIDYVGETLLPPGCHTYALAADDSPAGLRLTLRRHDGC